jgi:hypothetical protein
MSDATARNRSQANQQALALALERVRAAVAAWLKQSRPDAAAAIAMAAPAPAAEAGSSGEAPAIDTLAHAFGLSAFERDVLLLCAGPELDARFAALIGAAHGDPRRTNPTFALALAALPGAHWSALSPAGPLRRWRLIEAGAGESLTGSALRVDERVLHFLAGVAGLDVRLHGLTQPVATPRLLPESQRDDAERIARLLAAHVASWPVIQLCGDAVADQCAVAAAAAGALGFELRSLRAVDVPATAAERELLARLLEREAVLGRFAWLVDLHDAEPVEQTRAAALFETIQCPAFTAGRDAPLLSGRNTLRVDITRPPAREQHDLWRAALGPAAARWNGSLETVARQFRFGSQEIGDAAVQLRLAAARSREAPEEKEASAELWRICRMQSRARLEPFAQRMETAARWEDLVLPELQSRTLREIAAHVRQQFRVYETWGFAARSSRGLGVSALFLGASGTGKTLAAEVLATELQLDLFRIDLSAVVNKYIGETEKNLRRVFDAAEAGGAILLFDEADALFGKRSEVKDSHDRYANIEVGYLLQRMEAYRGLAILTTNVKNALDQAFLRRLRFVVHFPFPDHAERAAIWSRVFPEATPTDGLDPARLANLSVAGGNIRNIALNAAFLAADTPEPVRMKHLLHAARAECAKLERPVHEAELGGWI